MLTIEKPAGFAEDLTPGAILSQINEHCDGHRETNEADGVRTASVLDFAVSAQGDVNFLRLPFLPEGLPPGVIDAQLAPGSSRGSRHVLMAEDLAYVKFYRRLLLTLGGLAVNPDILGPVLLCDRNVVVTHPEHKWLCLPAGVWAVSYQQTMMDGKAVRAAD